MSIVKFVLKFGQYLLVKPIILCGAYFFYADWEGPPPSKGCEVLVVKLPRVVSLEELYRVFSPIGKNCFH